MIKILVIEDERTVQENILELLGCEGFEALAADNGATGIAIAQAELPDLILCDVMMPGIDGYGVLTTLRSQPQTALIPFIFLTAKSSPSDIRAGMESGADDYLMKPFTCTQLLKAISARLSRQAPILDLQQKIQDLQNLNILKDDLINTVSHDLRAPLANMKLAIQMLKVAATPEQQQRYMQILQKECTREANLVNNLLDLQRLESQTYQVSFQPVDLKYWLASVVEPFYNRAHERQQIVTLKVTDALPSIVSDPEILERIFAELLNNACKYTPKGGEIIFSLNFPLEPQQQVLSLAFTVSNQAEIPAAALPQLFERFYRVPGGDQNKQGGTGLGLALVQKLVERLEGTIDVSSQHQWTTFTVRFQANLAEDALDYA